ncbi:MAG: LysR family transcriptional regulator [Phycisphaerae bacterium]|nr:LysR family transcriptional regulator [Phycisphaerae bacterium]
MYLEAIKIFCDVVRQRRFSRAAAMNRVSQSAASQNVLQLERSLVVRLLDRSKRPFTLTPEGQVYYDGCKLLVEQYGAVEAQVRSLRNAVSGVVSVAAIYSVGLSGMSRYVQQFARLYPNARVCLAYLHPDEVVERVLTEEADLGLLSYPKGGRGLAVVPWCEEPMVAAGTLVTVALDHPRMSRPLGIIHRRRPRTPTEQAYIGVIRGLHSLDESRSVERPEQSESSYRRRPEGSQGGHTGDRRSAAKATV